MKHNTIKKRKIHEDCWALDNAFFKWLKERLPVYLKEADKIVNLEFYHFNFRERDYNQKELIKHMISLLNVIFSTQKLDTYEEEKEVLEAWAIIAPAMWW